MIKRLNIINILILDKINDIFLKNAWEYLLNWKRISRITKIIRNRRSLDC